MKKEFSSKIAKTIAIVLGCHFILVLILICGFLFFIFVKLPGQDSVYDKVSDSMYEKKKIVRDKTLEFCKLGSLSREEYERRFTERYKNNGYSYEDTVKIHNYLFPDNFNCNYFISEEFDAERQIDIAGGGMGRKVFPNNYIITYEIDGKSRRIYYDKSQNYLIYDLRGFEVGLDKKPML